MYRNFAYLYDQLIFDVDYLDYRMKIDKILQGYQQQPTKILEMACGTGNLTLELAKCYPSIHGFDLSFEMLSIAYNKLIHCDNISLFQGNMLDFHSDCHYDCVISSLDSINYLLEKKEVKKVFQNVQQLLSDGGVFLFDVNSYYKLSHVLGNNDFIYEIDGVFYTWRNIFDKKKGRIQFILDFFIEQEDGNYERIVEDQQQQAYSLSFLMETLKEVGFEKIKSYDFETLKDPTDFSERILISAQK